MKGRATKHIQKSFIKSGKYWRDTNYYLSFVNINNYSWFKDNRNKIYITDLPKIILDNYKFNTNKRKIDYIKLDSSKFVNPFIIEPFNVEYDFYTISTVSFIYNGNFYEGILKIIEKPNKDICNYWNILKNCFLDIEAKSLYIIIENYVYKKRKRNESFKKRKYFCIELKLTEKLLAQLIDVLYI